MKFYVRANKHKTWYALFSEVLPESIYTWAPNHYDAAVRDRLIKSNGIGMRWCECDHEIAEFDSVDDFEVWFVETYFAEIL